MRTAAILTLLLFFSFSEGNINYIGSDIQKCLNCLCHARTGCYSRLNCANYSICFDYWKDAGSPIVDKGDKPENQNSYKKCMKDENCILATIVQYADVIGHMDCNCDGKFDCKDRFAIHLFGSNCSNPKFGSIYSTRFNTCAKEAGVFEMHEEEGFGGCIPEVV